MNRHDRKITSQLQKIAEDLDNTFVGSTARIAAAVVVRNEIIGFGFNQQKTSTFQKIWGKNEEAIFWHSETHAIYNALKRVGGEENLRALKTRLYVVRVRYDSDRKKNIVWGLAAPCEGCRRCIKHHHINEVRFTLDSDSVGDKQLGVWRPNLYAI